MLFSFSFFLVRFRPTDENELEKVTYLNQVASLFLLLKAVPFDPAFLFLPIYNFHFFFFSVFYILGTG